jgi:predicted AAA+ superfamily ATPase
LIDYQLNMSFSRKLEGYLTEWRENTSRKPLIIRGARQVGKSTLIRKIGGKYRHFIELNLERQADLSFFSNFSDVQNLMEAVCFSRNLPFEPLQTLLFIDEIQEFPEAIQLLRFFFEDLPHLSVIAAGSLLEFALGDVSSFPVGRVEQVVLRPMDFEEFLLASGENMAAEQLRKVPLNDFAFPKLMDLFNRYIIIGGMPEVIRYYVENNKSLIGLAGIYSSIWDVYKDDIEKYGRNESERKILRHIVNTAPYVKDRFTFSGFGQSQYKSREIGEAFRALELAGLIQVVFPTTNTAPPLLPDLKRKPRLQFLDTGLMNYASNIQAEMLVLNDFTDFYRGFVVNHIVAQEIIAQQTRLDYKPVFWVREKTNSNAEVDACVKWKNLVIPIEVKSGAQGRLRSLHEFIDACPHSFAVRILGNKLSVENGETRSGKAFTLLNLPYFCASKLDKYLDWFIPQHPPIL